MADAPERIVTLHMNPLGDLLFTLPALAALRAAYPAAHIASVVRPPLAPLLESTGLVTTVLPRPRGVRGKRALIRALAVPHPDLLISFSQSLPSGLLALASRAPLRAGFSGGKLDGAFHVLCRRSGPPSTANHLRLMELLGVPPVRGNYQGILRVPAASTEAAQKLLPPALQSGGFVLVAPDASPRRRIKEWPAVHWDRLCAQLGAHAPVVRVGAAAGNAPNGALDLGGKTDMLTLAALCGLSRLCIGVDSGILHLASAVGAPVVGIFGPTDSTATGPQNPRSAVVSLPMACAPCHSRRCRLQRGLPPPCLNEMLPEQVYAAARPLLGLK